MTIILILAWIFTVAAILDAITACRERILQRMEDYQEENRRRLARLDAILKPASRCPLCGHPVISAPFCDETAYVCPDCAETFVWILDPKTGMYRLEQPPQNSAQT